MTAQELPESNSTVENLDVRGRLTVDGAPVLPGGALLSDNVTLKGNGLPGTEFAIKEVQKADTNLLGNGTVASKLQVNPNLSLTSVQTAQFGNQINIGGNLLGIGAQLAVLPDGANLGGDLYSKGTSETGVLTTAAIGPGNVNDWNPANLFKLWSQVHVPVVAAGATLTGISGTNISSRIVTFYNDGPGVLVVKNQSGLSAGGNRISTPGGVDLIIVPGASFQLTGNLAAATGAIARAVAITASTIVGVGAPNVGANLANLAGCPVGTTYRQQGTSIEWTRYGANADNWRPLSMDVADGFLLKGAFEDFDNSNPGVTNNIGTGVTSVNTGLPGRPGVATMSVTNAATLDRTRWFTNGGGNPVGSIVPGGGQIQMFAAVNVTTLPDGVDNFTFRTLGFDNLASLDGTNGFWLELDLGTNGSNNWFLVTADNGVRTRTDTGVVAVAGAWTRLGVVVNADGTLVTAYINDVAVVTSAVNIPSAGRGTGFISQLIKTLGNVNARTVLMDYVYIAALCDARR